MNIKRLSITSLMSLTLLCTAPVFASCTGNTSNPTTRQDSEKPQRKSGKPGGPQLGTPGGGPVIDKSADSTLLAIINNANIEESAKQEAIQDMIRLTEISEKENAAETLLMAKGFSDPVVSISSEKVDVVVNASSITDAQRAQIEDIVKRKAEVQAENIIITLLNLAD